MNPALNRRSLRKKLLLALVTALVVFAALAAALVLWHLPDGRAARIPGLLGPVSVTFDDRGVPRVVAATLNDALRAQGWLTARERAFQLELHRRAAAGELAEVFGPVALESDRLHRTYGFARLARAAVPLLAAGDRAELEALADGINAYLSARPRHAALELTVFGVRPRPWTPADSLLVLLLMHEDLSSRWESELGNARLAKLPPSLRDFLVATHTDDDVPIVPDAAPLPRFALPEIAEALPRAASLASGEEPEVPGSNGWAVAGALTKSGKPILANDPHLGLTLPGIWLPMRLEIGGRPVEGVTLPGLPGVILGRNATLAWGFTNMMTDVQDLYAEVLDGDRVRSGAGWVPLARRVETIAVRGRAPEAHTVRETPHGPLVDETHALRWLALDPSTLRLASGPHMLAATPAELNAALDSFAGPPQNVVFAWAGDATDPDGAIGWRAAGRMPIRRAGTDGSVPYDGTDPANDWTGVVPPAEMPRVLDPPEGFVVTANQRTIGTSFPRATATDWPSPARARRIRDLLAGAKSAGRKIDRDATEAMQMDIVSDALRAFVPPFLPHLPKELAADFGDAGGRPAWDGAAREADRGTLVARALRAAFRERALAAWGVEKYGRFWEDDRWIALASADDAAFRRAGLGPRDAFLKATVEKALADVAKRNGEDRSRWTWGRANRLRVRHPLGRVPGLSWLFDPPFPEQNGHGGTVKASSPAYGQSMRFVVDWNEPSAATLVIPFGPSGHLGSRHRVDQLRPWLAGDPGGAATRLARPSVGKTIELLPAR